MYICQPPGFEDGTGRAMILHHALYGLKHADHAEHKQFYSMMLDIGNKRSLVDPVVFVRHTSQGTCIIHSHVDDCACTGPLGEIDSDYNKLQV
jgi:hypothetical protein